MKMTSALVLLITSLLHFGLRGSCFLNLDKFPMVPGTVYASHITYCAILHFLYDMEVLPQRYKRRMNCLASFLFELVLGVAIMEVLALWLWCSAEHIIHLTLQFMLRRYCGMSLEFYQQWEWAIMGSVMTTLSVFLWINAYEATDPNGRIGLTKGAKQQKMKQKQKKTQLVVERKVHSEQEPAEGQDPLTASQ